LHKVSGANPFQQKYRWHGQTLVDAIERTIPVFPPFAYTGRVAETTDACRLGLSVATGESTGEDLDA
jgi:hypothetical protein